MSSFSEHSAQSLNKFLTGQQFPVPVSLLRAWNCKEMPLSDLGLSCWHQTTIIPNIHSVTWWAEIGEPNLLPVRFVAWWRRRAPHMQHLSSGEVIHIVTSVLCREYN